MASSRQLLRQQDVPGALMWSILDDPLFTDPFSAMLPFSAGTSRAAPGARHRPMAIDVIENEKQIEIHADIPGVQKDDIHLEVEDSIMSISVDSKQAVEEKKEEEGITYHRAERSHIFCKRSVRLPEHADTGNVQASYDNGVLKVSVPKKEVKDSKQKITIG